MLKQRVSRENASSDVDLSVRVQHALVEVDVCVAPEPLELHEGSSSVCRMVVACPVVGTVAAGCAWARFTAFPVSLQSDKVPFAFWTISRRNASAAGLSTLPHSASPTPSPPHPQRTPIGAHAPSVAGVFDVRRDEEHGRRRHREQQNQQSAHMSSWARRAARRAGATGVDISGHLRCMAELARRHHATA